MLLQLLACLCVLSLMRFSCRWRIGVANTHDASACVDLELHLVQQRHGPFLWG
jgi:hypothetical protein